MNVIVELTSPEHHASSAMPAALRDLYYHHDGLTRMIKHYGCPNTGGQHTCTISGERADVVAWLDLFLEEHPKTKPEIDIIKRTIRREFVNSPLTNRLHVKLGRFNRQHAHNGSLISRPWFWHESHEPDYIND